MEPAFRGRGMGRAWDLGTGIDGHRVLRRWDRHRFDGVTRLLRKGRLGLPGHARVGRTSHDEEGPLPMVDLRQHRRPV